MSTKTEQYVTDNYPYAKKAGEKFAMDPLVILAQGSFESAWGTSNLSKKYNISSAEPIQIKVQNL
ncbi:MAG: Mannosyl-glycoprotein endo-beta-N-acetylglucosaminidase [Bacteroidota bacterium]